jgi:hypothetical protein
MPTDSPQNDKPRQNYEPVVKSAAQTIAEEYLGVLCEKYFLSMWSYPGVMGANRKEICDLLVVFGDHVIIFSDKLCTFQPDASLDRAWTRWFKSAIAESANQLWGAQRRIKHRPSEIFLDKKSSQRLPLEIPNTPKFHLIAVAHGISEHIAKYFGGTGSLLIKSDIRGTASHLTPFHVGDLDPTKGFVHVFDDDSLHTVMATLDTISDFVRYLEKREQLLRGKITILSPGEEELLAVYLRTFGENGEHDFSFLTECPDSLVAIEEGHWADFQKHPRRVAQIRENKISYSWDRLIEKFSGYALQGTQHFVSAGGLKDAEIVLRFMAGECRFTRRVLAKTLLEMLSKTPKEKRRLRLLLPTKPGRPCYVFLLLPPLESLCEVGRVPPNITEYREVRLNILRKACLVARRTHPELRDIVGIATESGIDRTGRSEDSLYLDGRHWTEEMEEEAKEAQTKFHIFEKPNRFEVHAAEYPAPPFEITLPDLSPPQPKHGRNERCDCGSGKKYKHCCIDK